MPRFERPFKIQLPVITLPVTHGARPAIVLFSMTDRAQPALAMSTCLDMDGRGYNNVPLHINVIREACQAPMTFIETDERILAPSTGIILPR